MLFLPAGNETDPCSGLVAYNAARPPYSDPLMSVLIGISIALSVKYVLSIPVLYHLRNDPRFYKIRPFSMSLAIMLTAVAYVCGCLLPEAIPGFPCTLVFVIRVFGSTLATSVTAVRILVFVVESQYSINASQESNIINDNASVASSHKQEEKEGIIYVIKETLALGFGFRDINKMTLDTLSQIRRHYVTIFFVHSIPPFVALFIAIISIPVYRSACVNCPIGLEFFLTLNLSPSITTFFITNLLVMGFKYKNDEQQVMQEMVLTMIFAPWWTFIGYGLEVGDPNQLSYNRIFSWEILVILGPFFFWFILVGLQIYKALVFRRAKAEHRRQRPESTNSSDLLEMLNKDEEFKRDFLAFASTRYTMESMNFLLDISSYKRYYEERSVEWRRAKARKLIEMYIQLNSQQEINISAKVRDAILRVKLDEVSIKLFELFDPAFHEILDMVRTGIFIDFGRARWKKNKHGSAVVVHSDA
jgi:hypothetical protein